MDVMVRPAVIGDLFWLRLLYQAAVEEQKASYPIHTTKDYEAFTASMAARLGNADPTFICWVAEQGEQIVGFILAEILYRGVGEPHHYCTVYWLYTIPAARGQGIGRALCTASGEDAQRKGVEMIELLAQPGDPQWLQRGWVPVLVTYALPMAQCLLSVTPTHITANGHAETPEEAS